jgi:molecular chaperone DnaK (HSP70)
MEGQNEQETIKEAPGLALGIDFGNSKISGAVWNCNKKAPSIVLFDEKYEFPATLYYKNIIKKENEDIHMDNNSFDVGVEFSLDQNVDYFIYDIKKLLGQKKKKENEQVLSSLKYKIGIDQEENILYNLEENYIQYDYLSSILIDKIKRAAEAQFKDVVNSCTISVPHGFNYNQRAAVKNAALMAGIKNVFIINEPLSTAIYYASKNKIQKTENILIIDFGSSKLDVTLVSINNKNSIKVKMAGGDSTLGGDIFNKDLFNDVMNSFKYEEGKEVTDIQKLLLLDNTIEKAKKILTFQQETDIKIEKLDGEKNLNYKLKRSNFNEISKENYNKIYNLINKVIIDSKMKLENLDHIILQGEAIRIVGLTDLIKEKFKDIDIIDDLYDSIAYGNAIYTAKKLEIMNNSQFDNFKIYDITPISLGIRTEGDLMSVMLPRGSRIPVTAIKRFNTTQDNQNTIKFEIYEGERKLIKDNRRIERIILKNLPQMNKKEVKVEVVFEVDEEFILTVICREISNNIQNTCQIIINEDLTQKEILNMVEEAKKYEKEDQQEKERIQVMLKLNDKIFEYSHFYEDNEDILRELEGYRNWIKHTPNASKEEYEEKLKELNEKMKSGGYNNNNTLTRKQTETLNKKTIKSENVKTQ